MENVKDFFALALNSLCVITLSEIIERTLTKEDMEEIEDRTLKFKLSTKSANFLVSQKLREKTGKSSDDYILETALTLEKVFNKNITVFKEIVAKVSEKNMSMEDARKEIGMYLDVFNKREIKNKV